MRRIPWELSRLGKGNELKRRVDLYERALPAEELRRPGQSRYRGGKRGELDSPPLSSTHHHRTLTHLPFDFWPPSISLCPASVLFQFLPSRQHLSLSFLPNSSALDPRGGFILLPDCPRTGACPFFQEKVKKEKEKNCLVPHLALALADRGGEMNAHAKRGCTHYCTCTH